MPKLNPNALPFNPTIPADSAAAFPLLHHQPPPPIFLRNFFFYPALHIPSAISPLQHNILCYNNIPPPLHPQPPFPESLQESSFHQQDAPRREPLVSRRRNHLSYLKDKARRSSSAEYFPGECLGTTLMIRNVPNKLTRQQILELLDSHCRKENMKILKQGSECDILFSEFDFLYLPMDFMSGSNLGYAFVNFTSAVAAERLFKDIHEKPWNVYGSRKITQVTEAKIQGLSRLMKHFKNSIFACCSAEYMPVYFYPSRDGFRRTKERVLGKLVHNPPLPLPPPPTPPPPPPPPNVDAPLI